MGTYKTIENATARGSRLDVLMTLRRKLAQTLDGTHSGRDIPPLAKQLREVCAEIEAIRKGVQTEEERPEAKNVLEIVRIRHQKDA